MIYCHFPNCGYATEKDDRLKKHRMRHRSFSQRLQSLGGFWGILKTWVLEIGELPTIGNLLGQGEM